MSMRLAALGLLVPLCAAACGQSLQPLKPFDAGFTPDDLTTGGGGAGGDMAGAGAIDLAGADFAGTTPDTTGPVITYVKPMAGTFVGGLLDLTVTVADPSGVQPGSVKAVINNDPTNYTLVLGNTTGDTYHVFFDLGTLGKGIVFLSLSVRADDRLGNHSELGEEVILDNTPPRMTMDGSIQLRVSKLDMTKIECSLLFGPLGPTVVDPINGPEVAYEGAVMKQIMGLRARIEDGGNHAAGQRVDYISDIDETTVTLFAVATGSSPLPVLAVDTDGDGKCDDVNPTLVPTSGMVVMSNQALALALAPLTDVGSANFHADGSTAAGCDEVGTAMELPPGPLCTKAGTGLTFVIPGAGKDKPIYSVPPIHDPDACVGFPVDALNHLTEGPACVITRAVDHAGNHMVSYPLHICIDLGHHMCDAFVPDPLACRGTLTNGTVSATPACTEAVTFPKSGEIRYLPAFM
ncbi:MAG TPA: hypothetical protein VF997_05185 [Polyangia bacterium]